MSFLPKIINNFAKLSKTTPHRLLSTFSFNTAKTPHVHPHFASLNNPENNPWIYQRKNPIKSPFIPGIIPVSIPNVLKLPLLEPVTISETIIDDPLNVNNEERQAVTMIIVRRKKMKKHKLRKLRKRMKYENMKKRQRRELAKERAFHAELIAQCKEAEKFDAEGYVKAKLERAAYKRPPLRYYKGQRVPEGVNLEEYLDRRKLQQVVYIHRDQ